MTGERSYAILPCPDLDEALDFYGALGFTTTYRQVRPNPCGIVASGDLQIHLAAIDGFDPATSVSSVIITVDDVDEWYVRAREGLRERFGRVPSVGAPRLLRPRRKAGTTTGFSIVDVGGNWLRFYATATTTEDDEERSVGLARVLEVAARQGDARGDEAQAVQVLTTGLARYPDAEPEVRIEAIAYRAELLHRSGRDEEAKLDALTVAELAREHDIDAAETMARLRDVLGEL